MGHKNINVCTLWFRLLCIREKGVAGFFYIHFKCFKNDLHNYYFIQRSFIKLVEFLRTRVDHIKYDYQFTLSPISNKLYLLFNNKIIFI
jgi:hypothetical protein